MTKKRNKPSMKNWTKWFPWLKRWRPFRKTAAAVTFQEDTDYETVEATEEQFATFNTSTSNGASCVDVPPANKSTDFNDDSILTEDSSEVVTDDELKQLSSYLPARLLSSTWKKQFFTSRHGYSLASLYRALMPFKDRPALLLVRDMNGFRFGAFVTESFHISPVSFGCGETFVFSLEPHLRVWKWTQMNNFFVLCSNDSLCVGIDDGKFAIFIDESLEKGWSQPCCTFSNEPLSPSGDFRVGSLEVWVFE